MRKELLSCFLLTFAGAGCSAGLIGSPDGVASVDVRIGGEHPSTAHLEGPPAEAEALREDLLASLAGTALVEHGGTLSIAVGDDEHAVPLAAGADLGAIDALALAHGFARTEAPAIGTTHEALVGSRYRAARAELADYLGYGTSQETVFRPATGGWSIYGTSGLSYWGQTGDIPVLGDYDGDGKADRTIYRPATGEWWVVKSSGGTLRYQWGGATFDVPMPGDYDGDGKTDPAVWRPFSTEIWVWSTATGQAWRYQFGTVNSQPVPGDYDGDGKTDPALMTLGGPWTYLSSRTGSYKTLPAVTGSTNQTPAQGDYDGDGKTDPAVFDGREFWIAKSTLNVNYPNGAWTTVGGAIMGTSSDRVLVGDYDRDGKADCTIRSASTGIWYWVSGCNWNGYINQFAFGLATDQPVPWNQVRIPPIQINL